MVAEYHPARSSAHKADQPFDHCAVDLMSLPESIDGKEYVFVYVDVLSKYAVIRSLADKSMATVASEIWKVFADYGVPKVLQSDNGSEFVNALVAELVALYGVQHRRIQAYTPRANGQVERTNRSILEVLRKTLHGYHAQWTQHIPYVQLALNTRKSTATQH